MSDIRVLRGTTFSRTYRYVGPPYVYIEITGITNAAPVVITAPGHGLSTGDRVGIVGVEGMTQINAQNNPPLPEEYHAVTVIDTDTFEINRINSLPYDAYTDGGVLVALTPVSLAGKRAEMVVDTPDTVKNDFKLTSNEGGGIVLDDDEHTIRVTIPAMVSSSGPKRIGKFRVDLIDNDVVTRLDSGSYVEED